MPSSYYIMDYRSTYFEYKDLAKIHSQPDIDSILRIFLVIKTQCSKSADYIGGGQLGYLVLVL